MSLPLESKIPGKKLTLYPGVALLQHPLFTNAPQHRGSHHLPMNESFYGPPQQGQRQDCLELHPAETEQEIVEAQSVQLPQPILLSAYMLKQDASDPNEKVLSYILRNIKLTGEKITINSL